MTSDRIFNALCAYLDPLVQAAGGVFSPSETVASTLAMLGQSPAAWRCILQWQREDPTKVRTELRVRFLLIVQQGRGLSVAPGEDVTVTRSGNDPLLKRFNTAAGWMRAVYFANLDIEKAPMEQGATQWLNDPSFPTRQISAEFSVNYGPDPVQLMQLTIPAAQA